MEASLWFVQEHRNYHAMNAFCYVCNEQSTDCRRNFAETKSQYTQTPIADFINSILADFNSERNVHDESNCICTECLKRINDYDWTCQQAIEQEAKLRHLLFSTELTLRYLKNAPVEIKVEIENCHNERTVVGGLRDLLGECDIRLESDDDVDAITTTMIRAQRSPTPTLPPLPPLAPLQASTSNPIIVASVPAAVQPNPTSTPVNQLPNQQKQYVIEQHGQQCKVVQVSNQQKQTQTSDAGNGICVATEKPIKLSVIPVRQDTTSTPIQPNYTIAASSTSTAASGGTHPKPTYSYPLLIALVLKNSRTGSMPVTEIYAFLCAQFPYFRTAPISWKNSVRHVLSMMKCFKRKEIPIQDGNRPKSLWSMHPSMIPKMDEEIRKILRKDPTINRMAMANPENLPALLRGVLLYGDSNGELNKTEYTEPENDATDLINDLFGNVAQPMAKRKRSDCKQSVS